MGYCFSHFDDYMNMERKASVLAFHIISIIFASVKAIEFFICFNNVKVTLFPFCFFFSCKF